jgi:excisionase family DNA binding protein
MRKLYVIANRLSIKIFALTNRFFEMYKLLMNLLTTKEVAERLGVTVRRVQALIQAGRLPAQKVGRDFLIQEKDIKLIEDRKPGRPKASAAKRV